MKVYPLMTLTCSMQRSTQIEKGKIKTGNHHRNESKHQTSRQPLITTRTVLMLIRLSKLDKKSTTNSRLCVGHPEQRFLSQSSEITWRVKKEIMNFLLNNLRSFIPAYNSLQLLLWRQEISQKISTRIYTHMMTLEYT